MSLSTPPAPVPRIPGNYIENGREYHAFRKGKYLFPCDETEMDRMDIYHKFFSVARREALHSAPLTPNFDGPRILDLGTGTGIWAIDMCESQYRNAEVQGVDLTQIQPEQIPPNLTFLQRDIEGAWHGMGEESWDLIHMRMLNGCIENWRDIYTKIFRHLKPNFGWVEHVEIDMLPRCDDGTLPLNSQLVNWTRAIYEATELAYRPMAYNTQTRAMLESVGFVDISEEVIKIPLNPWPTDPHLKDIGRWYNLGLTQGLEALSLAPLMRVKNWKRSEVDQIVQEVKMEVCSKRIHAYCNMHIWIARKPAA
ncbi:Secondary metabolism regulator LAE1 [Lachnellula hyalina]|uniref:Secondary metabolism regulator LAE1 n=1 Tax=Lachnellula hyalina TaxID=1316788 RepID=A0A8H8TWL3_9HELO|nr:Secondary metabolism regulator LAE1 [Lachnellula hyalina]TVY23017.1 Secondary metabolism regulator LAE1 [Lachnellula hyalina]